MDDTSEKPTSDVTAARGRDSLFITATLHMAHDPAVHEVRIRNLSAGGLMAEFAAGAPIGAAVSLEMRGLGQVGGRVAWSVEGRIGIAFDRPVDPKRARKPIGGDTGMPFRAKNTLR